MVDQLDRDYELVSYNQHPYQLFLYEVNNKRLALDHEEYEIKKSGQNTLSDEILAFANDLINDELRKYPEGHKISVERLSEIVNHVLNKAKAQQNKPSQDSRGPDGNINDYLEVRRPFISPTVEKHTN